MNLIAGVDIGNSTTEVCIGRMIDDRLEFLASALQPTTGTKGTIDNIYGVKSALESALHKLGKTPSDLSSIRINEAVPVLGDSAMETITETIITDSTMIGHNPHTPAGVGCAVGILKKITPFIPYTNQAIILLVPAHMGYEEVAAIVNNHANLSITGVILENDEAVLVENRLYKKIPIVDEVKYLSKIQEGHLAAIEVALPGETIKMLSNPYGIATLLELNPDETKQITPIAKSLMGHSSGVVIKTPTGKVAEQTLAAGEITFYGDKVTTMDVNRGAEKIMESRNAAHDIQDIQGQPGTNIGNMLARIRSQMATLTGEAAEPIRITDLLAVDTFAPVKIAGALAGETCLEKAVAVAAMVRTKRLSMEKIADSLYTTFGIHTTVAGVEAVMATLGAMTTPGTQLPLSILDLGSGTTDAAILDQTGHVRSVHLAGAGELVTMLIALELGIDRSAAELIKRYPLGKVESLFHVRLETGGILFFENPLDPTLFGNLVLLDGANLIKLDVNSPLEKIAAIRKEAKSRVFVTNALRALGEIAPDNELGNIPNVVLVGGSAQDFEIPEMLTEALFHHKIVCGRGNIRKSEGPRNAVATGLLMSYIN